MKIYQELVDHFGGQQQTAKGLKVAQPSVSAWVTGRAQMSAKVALRAERVTNGLFKAEDLCPQLKEEFPEHAIAS